jgi:hypothetical protein
MLGPLVAPEAAGDQTAQRRRRLHLGDRAHEGGRGQLGQVARERGHLVVQFGIEHEGPPAQVADERSQPPQRLVVDMRRRGQHPGRTMEQVDPGGQGPPLLGSRHGVTGDDPVQIGR